VGRLARGPAACSCWRCSCAAVDVDEARALVGAKPAYVVACVAVLLWATATSSLTSFGLVNIVAHALFVGWLTVAQHRALAALEGSAERREVHYSVMV